MLSAVIDSGLFEECDINKHSSYFSKEIDTDFTCVLSQITKRLSKLLGFNVLGMNEEKTTEPVSIFPYVSFQDDLNELLKHASEKEEDDNV